MCFCYRFVDFLFLGFVFLGMFLGWFVGGRLLRKVEGLREEIGGVLAEF